METMRNRENPNLVVVDGLYPLQCVLSNDGVLGTTGILPCIACRLECDAALPLDDARTLQHLLLRQQT